LLREFKFSGYPIINAHWLKVGISKGKVFENGIELKISLNGNRVNIGQLEFELDEIASILGKSENKMHAVTENGLIPLEIRGRSYFVLKGLERIAAPYLEINGIHMHKIIGTDPWKDAMTKVTTIKIRKGDLVLDTCTGLGYTAIAAKRRGAKVVTVEKSPEVVELARWNPWSRELEEVEIILSDVRDYVKTVPDNAFDKIIHDPPVITVAGEVYSRDLYEEFYRILKPGGELFHYVGNPGKKRGLNIARGVMERLREVGFKVVKARKAEGVVAVK